MTNLKFTLDFADSSTTLSTVTHLRNELAKVNEDNGLGLTEAARELLINEALVYRVAKTDTDKGPITINKVFEFVSNH